MIDTGTPAAPTTLLGRGSVATTVSKWLGIATLLASACAAAQDQYAPTCLRGGRPGERSVVDENRVHILELEAAKRNVGADSPDLLPAISTLTQWYVETQQCALARPLYRRTVGIIEKTFGREDLRLAQPLTGLADTYVGENTFRAEGREALVRVVRLYENADPMNSTALADALIALGDWQLLSGDRADALGSYARAWYTLADAVPPLLDTAHEKLGTPTMLPATPHARLPAEAVSAMGASFITIEFDATLDGTPKNVKVVDSNVDGYEQRAFRRLVLQAHYRPAVVNGHPAETHAQMQHIWR